MRDYGKVHTSFWTSETIRSMSEDARSLAMYLLTCPHNTIAGVFRLPDGYICDDMQWTPERVSKAFNETVSKGFANRCETTKWVWINKHLEWNPPENPNQRKCAAKISALVPDKCCWKHVFMRDCSELMGIKQEPLHNPSQTLSKPEAGTEAGTEVMSGKPDNPVTETPKPKKRKSNSAESVEILEYLNSKVGSNFQAVESNTKFIEARIDDGATVDEMKRVIDTKTAVWKTDPKMSEYLRPSTLFNAIKYAQYAGQISISMKTEDAPYNEKEFMRRVGGY